MGTILARQRKTGGIAYLAKIQINREGRVVWRESKTHETEPAARRWIKQREAELDDPETLARLITPPSATLGDAIDRYMMDARDIGKTKEQVLNKVRGMSVAAKPCHQITGKIMVDLARDLAKDRSPQTVQNYLSHIAPLFRLARTAWGMELDPTIMPEAMAVARDLGLTSTSDRRDRRPTMEELDRLMTHFSQRGDELIPMDRITVFAIFSARRCEEITKLRWADLDGDRILVRDMKHPRAKKMDVWCDLTPEAQRIIAATPRIDERIFPYLAPSISSAWARGCIDTGVKDLRFHDLRHEAISRLFETGKDIPRVAAVSGHRSWQNLSRYTHIRQTGDRFAAWRWLDAICEGL